MRLKDCLARADELGVEIRGDVSFRGDCKVEDAELSDFNNWLNYNYPQYSDLAFHVPNEFTADKSKGNAKFAHIANRKNKGVKSGICDYVVLPIKKGAPAFLCEFKRKNIAESLKTRQNKQHFENQLMLLSSQKAAGNFAIVALGFEAAKAAFIEYVEVYG